MHRYVWAIVLLASLGHIRGQTYFGEKFTMSKECETLSGVSNDDFAVHLMMKGVNCSSTCLVTCALLDGSGADAGFNADGTYNVSGNAARYEQFKKVIEKVENLSDVQKKRLLDNEKDTDSVKEQCAEERKKGPDHKDPACPPGFCYEAFTFEKCMKEKKKPFFLFD